MMPNRQPLHIALTISVVLHLGVGFITLISAVSVKEPVSQNNRIGVFQTHLNSRIEANAAQVEKKKVNEVAPPLAPLQNNEQAQTDIPLQTDTMEYRRAYSIFSRPRLSGGSQGNAAAAFQQRYFSFQRKVEFIASSPNLQGECTVITSNEWNEFSVNCDLSQDVNFLRAELSSVALNKETISGLTHCLALRKNEILKKENCVPR